MTVTQLSYAMTADGSAVQNLQYVDEKGVKSPIYGASIPNTNWVNPPPSASGYNAVSVKSILSSAGERVMYIDLTPVNSSEPHLTIGTPPTGTASNYDFVCSPGQVLVSLTGSGVTAGAAMATVQVACDLPPAPPPPALDDSIPPWTPPQSPQAAVPPPPPETFMSKYGLILGIAGAIVAAIAVIYFMSRAPSA